MFYSYLLTNIALPTVQGILTEEDIRNIKMFALRLSFHLTHRFHEQFRVAFSEDIKLHSLYVMHRRIAILAGIVPELYDCCPTNCCAYTAGFKDKHACPYCAEARFDSNGKPRATFEYIPLIPRLQALFQNPDYIRRLQYRTERATSADLISDIFDGSHFKSLLNRQVCVNGVEYEHCFFDDNRDLAFCLLGDGFSMFKRAHRGQADAWPFIAIPYSLDPEIRTHIENVLPLFIIGGPSAPKNFNSFLHPFTEEGKLLAIGVRTFDALAKAMFPLRGYFLTHSGDMVAIRFTQCMKGPNAFCPCRQCRIHGYRDNENESTRYYVPLVPPIGTQDSIDGKSWDPANLPMRTDEEVLRHIAHIRAGPTKRERERRALIYGLNGASVLYSLPSISPTRSFPFEGMHLLFENHIPNMVKFWKGTYAWLDEGTGEYVIPKKIWEAIGLETVAAVKCLPSSFVSRIPDISQDSQFFTAEAWSFWFVYLAPHLLKGRFRKNKYYTHMLQLVEIIKMVLQFSITRAEVQSLRAKVIDYIEKYEKCVAYTILCLFPSLHLP